MTDEPSLKDQVFAAFLKEPNLGPQEMATKLKAKYNSVKDAYARLADEGLFKRSGRGNYEPNYPGIILNLMERIRDLEKQVK